MSTDGQETFELRRVASIVLILKGAVGGSLALLALFGVTVPTLDITLGPVGEGVVAVTGAVIGVVTALRA